MYFDEKNPYAYYLYLNSEGPFTKIEASNATVAKTLQSSVSVMLDGNLHNVHGPGWMCVSDSDTSNKTYYSVQLADGNWLQYTFDLCINGECIEEMSYEEWSKHPAVVRHRIGPIIKGILEEQW